MRFFVRSLLIVTVASLANTGSIRAQVQPDSPPPPGTPMVFLNTQLLLPQVPGAREAQETWQQELQQYNVEVDELRSEIDSLVINYRRQEAMLSPDTKQQRQQEIVKKQEELQLRAAELEQRAGVRQQELLKPILDGVQLVIEDIRQSNDYTFVFDIAAAGVLAADPKLDITALVLERLTKPDSSTAAQQQP